MKKRILFSILTMVFLTSLFPLMTSYAAAKPIVWRLRTFGKGKSYTVKLGHLFRDMVKERSNGRLQVEIFEAGTLGYSGFELQRVVGKGMLDAAQTMAALLGKGSKRAFGASSLPFLFNEFNPEYDKIAPRLAVEEAEPIFQEMANKMNLHYFNGWHFVDELNSNKKVATVKDWKGLKLRSWSPLIAAMGKALGTTTTTVPIADIYTSFATGVIDANVGDATNFVDNARNEVVDYINLWPVVAAHEVYVINEDSWAALDKDLQDIVTQVMRENSRAGYEHFWVNNWEKRKKAEELGTKIIKVAPVEIQKIRKIMKKEVWEPWLKGAGEYGKRLFDIMAKYN